MLKLTEEMQEFLEEAIPAEDLEKMSDKEKWEFCMDYKEAQDIALQDFFDNRE